MNHCPEFLRLLTHATFFEAAIARRMSLSDVVHWAELHVQLRIRTAFAVALSKFWWPPVFLYDQQGLTSQFLKPWDLMDKMLEGSLWMRSSLTEINGSWPVLVGLLDSFGVRNISTGTLGALPPVDLRVVCGDFIASILDSGTWQHGQLGEQQQHRVQLQGTWNQPQLWPFGCATEDEETRHSCLLSILRHRVFICSRLSII